MNLDDHIAQRELKAKLLWGLVRWVLIVAACVIIVRSLV